MRWYIGGPILFSCICGFSVIQAPPAAEQEAAMGEGEESIDPEVEKRIIASKIFKRRHLVTMQG